MVKIIGQKPALKLLAIAAQSRSSVLLVGAPGHGKTTLCLYYLSRFGRPLQLRADDKKLIDRISTTRDPIFIDEAHRIRVPEALYPFLDKEGGFLSKKRVFGLATTDQGKLPGPLNSRLILVALEKYTDNELAEIAGLAAPRLSPQIRLSIARYSHGSPRRVKMLTELIAKSRMNCTVDEILNAIGYQQGLNAQERAYLDALYSGPKSLSTLAGILGMGVDTVRQIESDLIAGGLVEITSRGREILIPYPSWPSRNDFKL